MGFFNTSNQEHEALVERFNSILHRLKEVCLIECKDSYDEKCRKAGIMDDVSQLCREVEGHTITAHTVMQLMELYISARGYELEPR